MQITVVFWGAMARHAGSDRRTIEIPNPGTVADAVQCLQQDPALASELGRCAYSVHDELVGASYPLQPGDELSLLPPVSGG